MGDYNTDVQINFPGATGKNMQLPYSNDTLGFIFLYSKLNIPTFEEAFERLDNISQAVQEVSVPFQVFGIIEDWQQVISLTVVHILHHFMSAKVFPYDYIYWVIAKKNISQKNFIFIYFIYNCVRMKTA